jgi:Uma2 family endonuclease
MGTQSARRLFTTDEYHRMAETGILSEDDRVELLDGEIVRMSPIGSRHAACVDRLAELFTRRLPSRAIVRIQSPILLGRRSEPQPDLALLKRRADYYAERHPQSADVLLVIEVVDSSREVDRGRKLPLYARSGIPEVWVIDLKRDEVEVYRRPALRGYQDHERVRRGQRVAPMAFPRTAFSVGDMLV